MSISVTEALTALDDQSAILRARRERLNREWHPDDPPLSVTMSDLAQELGRSIKSFNEHEMSSLFSTIESLLSDADNSVRDAIATGFLESLLGQASAKSLDFKKVSRFLGPKSRLYCEKWDEFTGVKTIGL